MRHYHQKRLNVSERLGKRVVFTGCDDAQRCIGDDPRSIMKQGEVYLIESVEEEELGHLVTLKDHPDKRLNSVCFKSA